MEFRHVSVLLNECIEGLNIKKDGIYAVSYTHLWQVKYWLDKSNFLQYS